MPLFNTYRCTKCLHTFEGIVDVCSRCGSVAARVSGIEQCIASGHPPGIAGGKFKPHSARSLDRCMEENFKVLKISNCTHKDGVPQCTFNRPQRTYNSMPGWASQGPAGNYNTQPIRAYQSLSEMARESGFNPRVTYDGAPLEIPSVHPEVQPGAQVSPGVRGNPFMRGNTVFTHVDKQKE